jgi:glycosyltransferase involved in cell wall biosynthesis
VLWLVQDGVLAGPGASQTLPYLRGLAAEGFRMSLLSFEKAGLLADRERVRATAEELRAAGVAWMPVAYGAGPAGPRTLLQLARAVASGRGLVGREGVALVHARSYVPALMATFLGRPWLFDMRGLWPQERVDGGLWRGGSFWHRIWEWLERRLLDRASGVVLLAEGARELLPPLGGPVRVIPTAVDLERFMPGLPPPAGAAELAGREVYVVSGALGTWYLLEPMLDLLALALARSDASRALLLTEEDAGPAVRGLLRRGVTPSRVVVAGVPHREVPRWVSLATAGIFLIESAPSKRASAPTKLGEFLACGVPVVITPGIGDSEALVNETRTGVVVRELGPRGYGRALEELSELRESGPELAERCRRAAEERLSLSAAVMEYAALYREITCA